MGREWALREAHLEIARREKAGLPLISPDLIPRSDSTPNYIIIFMLAMFIFFRERVMASLPAEEELRDFDILI